MPGTLNLVDASIKDIQDALSTADLTSVDLVARYLRRIATYDCSGLALNAIPILNNQVFNEAAASDKARRSGELPRPLEGIPFTVKDSYKVKGMTVASGSPAFKELVANDNAFTVAAIKAAGGVLLGRTNMPPVAYGGMQRGVYGRAENPYNMDYLAAAWASGSSNGSAVSTASSMAAFGMGEETVSSGRSPASNNALVAYTPSRGWISIRGNWPLYPTCDVVVPHTRTMEDLLSLLKVISAEDRTTEGDFWRDQPFIKLERPWKGLPRDEVFTKISLCHSLQGLRVAIPMLYGGGDCPKGAPPVYTHPEVQKLLEEAKGQLEKLGAEVVMVPDFPPVTGYENPALLPPGCPRLPEDWNWYERGPLVAHGWDKFLRDNGDPNLPNLSAVNEMDIWPHSMRTEAELKHFPLQNAIHWGKLAGYLKEFSFYETPNLEYVLKSLEEMRKQLCDDYLHQHKYDFFAFPAQGDVAPQDSDVNPEAAAHAWKNGVWYSNGNRALRHLGIPSVTVPMGMIESKGVPMGLTFAGRAYDDVNLLKWANAFETHTRKRSRPRHTPPLPSDSIRLGVPANSRAGPPELKIQACDALKDDDGLLRVTVAGTVGTEDTAEGTCEPRLEITVNGQDIPKEQIIVERKQNSSQFTFKASTRTQPPAERNEREKTRVPVARDRTMVVVLARSSPDGYPSGHLEMI
jgi:Asp-tRNA(Asn)/Glu-tRNA(Gln) amidotransferase A subunit family amidase